MNIKMNKSKFIIFYILAAIVNLLIILATLFPSKLSVIGMTVENLSISDTGLQNYFWYVTKMAILWLIINALFKFLFSKLKQSKDRSATPISKGE